MNAWVQIKLTKHLTILSIINLHCIEKNSKGFTVYLADPVGQLEIMLLLCHGRHEVVIALNDFHCLRQAGREEGGLHLYASCTSLEISDRWD